MILSLLISKLIDVSFENQDEICNLSNSDNESNFNFKIPLDFIDFKILLIQSQQLVYWD